MALRDVARKIPFGVGRFLQRKAEQRYNAAKEKLLRYNGEALVDEVVLSQFAEVVGNDIEVPERRLARLIVASREEVLGKGAFG